MGWCAAGRCIGSRRRCRFYAVLPAIPAALVWLAAGRDLPMWAGIALTLAIIIPISPAAIPHRISSARRRLGPRPAHRRCGGSLRHIRSRAVVFRTGGLPHRAHDRGLLRSWADQHFRPKHSDRRKFRDLQFPALLVLRAHAHRQSAACDGRQSRRRPAGWHPSLYHGRDSLSPRVGARGDLRHSDRTGDDALLQFRLLDRPESLRRRHHRRPGQLSGDRRRRDLCRAV